MSKAIAPRLCGERTLLIRYFRNANVQITLYYFG